MFSTVHNSGPHAHSDYTESETQQTVEPSPSIQAHQPLSINRLEQALNAWMREGKHEESDNRKIAKALTLNAIRARGNIIDLKNLTLSNLPIFLKDLPDHVKVEAKISQVDEDGSSPRILEGLFSYVPELGEFQLTQGKCSYPDGFVQEGQFAYHPELNYLGLIRGTTILPDLAVCDGSFSYIPELGEIHLTQGKWTFLDGHVQEGQFAYVPEIKMAHLTEGTWSFSEGVVQEGQFSYNLELGKMSLLKGKWTFSDGDTQEGQFAYIPELNQIGLTHGKSSTSDGEVCEGQFVYNPDLGGMILSSGKRTLPDGSASEGKWGYSQEHKQMILIQDTHTLDKGKTPLFSVDSGPAASPIDSPLFGGEVDSSIQQMEQGLDTWLDEGSLQSLHNRGVAKTRILQVMEDGSNKVDLTDLALSCLPTCLKDLPPHIKIEARISQSDHKMGPVVQEGEFFYHPSRDQMVLSSGKLKLSDGSVLYSEWTYTPERMQMADDTGSFTNLTNMPSSSSDADRALALMTQGLDSWVGEVNHTDQGNRYVAKTLILNAIRHRFNMIDLKDVGLSSLPTCLKDLPNGMKVEAKISRTEANVGKITVEGEFAYVPELKKMDLIDGSRTLLFNKNMRHMLNIWIKGGSNSEQGPREIAETRISQALVQGSNLVDLKDLNLSRLHTCLQGLPSGMKVEAKLSQVDDRGEAVILEGTLAYIPELNKMDLVEGVRTLASGEVQEGKFTYIVDLGKMVLTQGILKKANGRRQEGTFSYIPELKKMVLTDGIRRNINGEGQEGTFSYNPELGKMVLNSGKRSVVDGDTFEEESFEEESAPPPQRKRMRLNQDEHSLGNTEAYINLDDTEQPVSRTEIPLSSSQAAPSLTFMQQNLDIWEKAGLDNEKSSRQVATARVLNAMEQGLNTINLKDLILSDLPVCLKDLPDTIQVEARISQTEVRVDQVLLEGKFSYSSSSNQMVLSRGKRSLPDGTILYNELSHGRIADASGRLTSDMDVSSSSSGVDHLIDQMLPGLERWVSDSKNKEKNSRVAARALILNAIRHRANKVDLTVNRLTLSCLPDCLKDLPSGIKVEAKITRFETKVGKITLEGEFFYDPELEKMGLLNGTRTLMLNQLMRQELRTWIIGCSKDEQGSREIAETRILNAIVQGSNQIDLKDLTLSRLPTCLKNLPSSMKIKATISQPDKAGGRVILEGTFEHIPRLQKMDLTEGICTLSNGESHEGTFTYIPELNTMALTAGIRTFTDGETHEGTFSYNPRLRCMSMAIA